MSKNSDYQPGNPEYDYWNDKNLYPSLRHDAEHAPTPPSAKSGDSKIGFGSLFAVIFGWILIFAPFAFFFTWEDGIVHVIFWGGIVTIIITFIICIYNAIQAEKQK